MLLAVGLVLAVGARADGVTPVSGWLMWGNDLGRNGYVVQPVVPDPTQLHLLWTVQLEGIVTSQVLALRDFPTPGETREIVGTSRGKLYVINQNGFVVGLKQLPTTIFKSCFYVPDKSLGITGTPYIDAATRTIYVVDGTGYLHALDLDTLDEQPGWPVRLFTNPRQQVVWGALSLIKGRIYASTGMLCQNVSTGAFMVDLATRKVTNFKSVPLSLGGGGGMWGWGGLAYDAPSNSLFAGTANALPGGRNRIPHFDEGAGYAEHMLQFDMNLNLKASQGPLHPKGPADWDFTGTSMIVRVAGCPPLVASENKNGNLYAWRLNKVAAGVYQRLKLTKHLNGQPAWSPATRSLYVDGQTEYYKIVLGPDCKFRLDWKFPLPTKSVNGPPLVTGNVVWLPVSEDQAVWGVDATTGRAADEARRRRGDLPPPTPLDGRLYVPGYQGLISAYG